ncbi:histidine phosphatase family protein [Pseudonocardia phyllosphaerae]|uniref:histidine phosphatase family protein n=1 Tax=Pseudonocardia phyllosphaerae TaxID=3390502 RepID=UPI00397D2039
MAAEPPDQPNANPAGRSNDAEPPGRIFLLRHGETEWSATGRHTGATDIGLTDAGRRAAARARAGLAALRGTEPPAHVLSSPRTRARDTAAGAGLTVDRVDGRLAEWDYGAHEGLTTPQIRETLPGWTVWDGPWPGGETPDDVGARADAVLTEARRLIGDGDVVLVGHGHFSRVLTVRWIGLPPAAGVHVKLDPAGVTVLGFERGVPRLDHVNCPPPQE